MKYVPTYWGGDKLACPSCYEEDYDDHVEMYNEYLKTHIVQPFTEAGIKCIGEYEQPKPKTIKIKIKKPAKKSEPKKIKIKIKKPTISVKPFAISHSNLISIHSKMNCVFKNKDLTIYENDYRDVIDKIKFDYIITDPPYNIKYKYNNYKDDLSETEYIDLLKPLAKYKVGMIHHIAPVIKYFCIPNKISPADNYAWCYNSNLGRQHRDCIFFNVKPNKKNVGMDYINKNDKRIIKRIAEGKQRQMTTFFTDINLIKNISEEKVKNFTNQIPIKLYERMIKLISKEGDTILDCFGGTGGLAIACKNLNRKCILIEPNHIDIIKQRLKISK